MRIRQLTSDDIIPLAFTCFGAFVAFTVARFVTANGLITAYPWFGARVFFRVDAASIVALFFIFLAGLGADVLTKASLSQDYPVRDWQGICMFVLILMDTVIFYIGCTGGSWSGFSWFSIPLTIAYGMSFFVFAYFNVYFWNQRGGS